MNAERWRRIRELFDAAADAAPQAWSSVLEAHCPEDPSLRAEALALLEADAEVTQNQTRLAAQAPDLLDELAALGENHQADAWIGRRLGAWRIVRAIGRGGMGMVYLAERDDGAYSQQAAIKLMRAGADGDAVLRRFRAERQILANLEHPHIARLLDGGVGDEGVPWFALEYVEGAPLTAACDDGRLNVPDRLRLFLDVCAAVAHAHERLVVHRDLKPANILVDAGGQVKLLDFGIAKLIEPGVDDGGRTQTALRAFTPEYAAPEQIRGELVTTAVDVYALGMLLYELLTGRRPYRVTQPTPAAYERAVLEQEPARPSGATTRPGASDEGRALARRRRMTPHRLRSLLRGDLDAIVLKALRKEPAQRYATVREFADDVRAVLESRPVAARRGGWRYRAGRFLRRHALAAVFAAAALFALVGGLAAALWQAHEARVQRDGARVEAEKARRVIDFLNTIFRIADPNQSSAGSVTARELLAEAALRIGGELTEEPQVRAELLTVIGRAQLGVGLYEESLALLEAAADGFGANGGGHRVGALLAQAEALQNLGRYRDVLARLDEVAVTPDMDERAVRVLAADVAYRRALSLQALGELDAAEASYREAIESRLALFGADAAETLDAQMRYSVLLTLTQRYDEARALAETVLARLRAQPDPAPLRLGEGIWALAIAIDNLGDKAQAEALYRERLALFESALGERHPRTAGATNDLANITYQRRDYAGAETLFRRAIDLFSELVGVDHPSMATYQNNLGAAMMAQGRVAQAREHLERAHDLRLRHYGADHHTVASSLHMLGFADLRVGDTQRAQARFLEALRIYTLQFGPDNPGAAMVHADLALAHFRLAHVDAACASAERAVAIAEAGKVSAGTAAYARAMQAQCLRERGQGDRRLREAYAQMREAMGEEVYRTRAVAALLQPGKTLPAP